MPLLRLRTINEPVGLSEAFEIISQRLGICSAGRDKGTTAVHLEVSTEVYG